MKYYLTTPLYYTNGAPHIGHAYATIAADVIRRFQRLMGRDAVLTTGVDEHGVNVERSARNAGKTPKDFSDAVTREFELNWEAIRVQADRFIRTSSPAHHRTVQWLFERCRKNGYAYKGTYTGQYCPFDNLYVNEAKPGDPCPDCGRPTETVSEENFFFRLSAFQERLLALYEQHPEFVQPESRRNEVIRFVRGGLADLSITRTTIQWGIPVPGEAPHVFYVWFDALIGYLSAAGGPDFAGEGLWPADLHLIGKEILRFHAVFWPAFLLAADLPLPKKIFAHGWLLVEQDKMSKSRGNIVRPRPICEVVGPEPLRYFLMREIVFGQDGSFSYEGMIQRYNADLANGLGNLCSRTLTMLRQYREGKVPAARAEPGLAAEAFRLAHAARDAYAQFEFSRALEAIWSLISAADKFIVERAPWKLAKDPAAQARLDETLYTALEVVRIATALASPVIPESAAKIWEQLGLETLANVRFPDLVSGGLAAGHQTRPPEAVFPRLEAKPLIEKMRALEDQERQRQLALLGRKETPEEAAGPPPAPLAPEITIDDFAKVDLRVGVVQEARKVEGADKLLHLSVDIGEAAPRSIVAGIATAYAPETLVGRKVVIVANLAPRKLRGLVSQGMIVAASLEGGPPVLAGFLEDVPAGARLK
jgi:methionyl-tRNA synthetase